MLNEFENSIYRMKKTLHKIRQWLDQNRLKKNVSNGEKMPSKGVKKE